jgi:hypothetical protein
MASGRFITILTQFQLLFSAHPEQQQDSSAGKELDIVGLGGGGMFPAQSTQFLDMNPYADWQLRINKADFAGLLRRINLSLNIFIFV